MEVSFESDALNYYWNFALEQKGKASWEEAGMNKGQERPLQGARGQGSCGGFCATVCPGQLCL